MDTAINICNRYLKLKYNTFFACSKFQEPQGRTAVNAKHIRSFWLDVDCGPNKDYPDQAEGLKAIKDFCKTLKLPKPTLVNSGNGWHVYWTMTGDLSYNDWKPVAEHLKSLCGLNGLKIDQACTQDAARILRVPETLNFKDASNPKEVSVAAYGAQIEFGAFKSLLGYNDLAFLSTAPKGQDDLTRSLYAGVLLPSSFKKIMGLSLGGEGCDQLAYCYRNQDILSEPLWRAALSIAEVCTDRDHAIHKMSRDYDGYSPADTERKASETKGPYSCSQFERLNQKGCEGCKVKEKIKTSPIELGRTVPIATPEENIITVHHKGLEKSVTNIIPAYPAPYFRPAFGGVWRKERAKLDKNGETPTEAETDVLVYENDLYIEKRLKDPELGEVMLIKLILPQDGLDEFTVPLTDIMAADKMKNSLGAHGVAASVAAWRGITEYVVSYVKLLQKNSKADIARAQFGWHDNYNAFVVGDRQINKTGVTYSPPSSVTANLVEVYKPKGSLDKWVEMVNLYGAPGKEIRAFILGTSFGAPLVEFSGLNGYTIHLTNPGSGQGKSTTQYVANSVWGSPKKSALKAGDKFLARQNIIGVLHNIVATIDELSNCSPEELSDLAYTTTDGSGRHRMHAHVNSIRKNNTTWANPTITSANQSMHEALLALKAKPEGEIMRVIELVMPTDLTMTKEESDYYYTTVLFENYGVACEPLMQYMISNLDDCKKLFKKIQLDFDNDAGFGGIHRYYSVACAVSLTGLEIAKRCGLHDIDIERVRKWMLVNIGPNTIDLKTEDRPASSYLGDFINEHYNNILLVNTDIRHGHTEPAIEPRGELLIRYERNTNLVFIPAHAFRVWCTKRKAPLRAITKELKEEGILLRTGPKLMTSGTKIKASV